MAEKPTTMVLNVVDLQCSKCYKKIKKLLCKFPQIRDQTYDEKANKVTIKVVCCSPEKIRDKLCCKGGGCIKSIEIKPDKPDKQDKPGKPDKPDKPDKPGQPNKPGQPDKPDKPPPPTKPKKQQISIDLDPKSKKQQISIDLDLDLQLQCGPPPPVFRCSGCCGGRTGGPCYCGWRVHCDPCCGTPVYGSCSGYGSGCEYFTEENPQACSIM